MSSMTVIIYRLVALLTLTGAVVNRVLDMEWQFYAFLCLVSLIVVRIEQERKE